MLCSISGWSSTRAIVGVPLTDATLPAALPFAVGTSSVVREVTPAGRVMRRSVRGISFILHNDGDVSSVRQRFRSPRHGTVRASQSALQAPSKSRCKMHATLLFFGPEPGPATGDEPGRSLLAPAFAHVDIARPIVPGSAEIKTPAGSC